MAKTPDPGQCIPHLRYLVDQLSAFAVVAQDASEVIQNAAIESSLLSLRIIDEFFSEANVQDSIFANQDCSFHVS
jgi:hypothetical protein